MFPHDEDLAELAFDMKPTVAGEPAGGLPMEKWKWLEIVTLNNCGLS